MQDARERNDEQEPTAAETSSFRIRLKAIFHYALLASPVLGLLGIVLAIIALVAGHAAPPPPDTSNARIEALSASLAETRSELESLRFMLGHERSARADERKEDNARLEKTIQHVSRLEAKSKVAPTLESELAGGAASAVPEAAPLAPPVVAPVVVKPATVPHAAEKKAAPPPAKPAAKPAPASAAKPAPAKTSPQVKSLKDAIEEFNDTPPKRR
jgi:hypothetical protein